MGRRGPLRLGLALAFVLVIQQAIADKHCRTGCKGNSQVFKYVPGTTYKYNYEGKIDISLSSAEGQVSSTDVKALVLLTQLADCNQLLRLQNVQISSGGNAKKHGHIPDVEKAIQLNFHDGHIEDSICAEAGDTQNSLNLKRAIASLFQANHRSGYETDVFGLCSTEVAQHHEGGDLVIQKNRDLNKCAYRENLRQDFFATTFNLNSEIRSSPLLNGDYNGKFKIKNGILNQANVVENYLYIPFSVGKNGARAEVISKLSFVGTSKDNPKSSASVPKSIIFDNPHPVVAPTSNVNTILNAVKEVVKSIDIVVGEGTAKEFVTLIKTIRAAKKVDLLSVYNQVRSGVGFGDKVVAKKIFLDALLQAGIGDAIEVAITLLKSHEFSEVEQKLVYIGLSMVRHSTEGAIKTAIQLLNLPNLPQEAYLGIGNLVGRFCKQHSCENVDAVNQITQKLVGKLTNPKTTDKKIENESILVLKTLANFGHLNDNIVQKIIDIAKNKQASDRLRAVALETYLSDSCKDKIRNSALSILQDIQQDSEIRIKAYLVLAQCPNAKIGNAIKALLTKELSYQVGGFITSHIRNLKASANPDKQAAKQFLNFSVPKKFPIDFRKWSYNGEFSYAIDTLGIAASAETNIIYSQESYLPRSANLNVSAEVFGHTFNFLEVNTRQENLDKLVEHYFGPKGVLRSSSLEKLVENSNRQSSHLWKHLTEKLQASLRTRRDVSKAEIDHIGKAVQIKENLLNKDLDLDVSIKAFGSEIIYNNLNIYQEGFKPEAIIDKLVKRFNEGLDKLKNFQEVFRTNLLFLDVELDYPTGLGFPLRLAVEGISNTQLKAEGGLDVRALLNNKETNINLKLVPSANIEVTGRLTLDALVVENGLKTISSLYTATGGDIKINLLNSRKGFDVKFGLPVPIQKLLSANHEIIFESRDQSGLSTYTPLKFAQAKDFSICLDQLSPFIGLSFCADINGPNLAGKHVPVLPFPLAGDAKVLVKIENEDVKEYHVKFVNNDYNGGDFLFETIGKNGQKKLSVEFQGEIHPEKFFKASLSSPIKTAFVEGRIISTNQEKSLLLKAGQDQFDTYVKLGVGISGSQDKQIYSPIVEYKSPNGKEALPIRVDGKIIVEKKGSNKKYIFDNLIINILPNQKSVKLSGNMGNEGSSDFFSDLTISEGQNSGSLKGRYHADSNLLKINAELKNSINPGFNIHLKGDCKKSSDLTHFESNWQLIHGQDLSSKTNIITLSTSATKKYKNVDDFTVGFKNKITYPLAGVNINVEYEQEPKKFNYDLDFGYNEIKFGSELDVEINKKSKGDFDLEFEIYGLDNKVEFKSTRELQGETKSKIANELNVNGMKLEVKGTVTHNIKPSNVDVGADLTVILPTHPTPFKIESGLRYNTIEIDVSHKVTSGNVVIVDGFVKANKNGNANASIKVNIKSIVEVNGQLKSVNGNGNGHVQINALSLKKQIRLESTFNVQPGTTYHVVLTLYPSYDKDKTQKIILSTNTKVSQSNLDSKNSLSLLGKVLEVNLQGTLLRTAQNGKHNFDIEIILPTDQYLLAKYNGQYTIVVQDKSFNEENQAILEYRKNKNTPGRKLSISSKNKNIDFNAGLYDTVANIAAEDSTGNNINADLTFKVQKQGEKRVIDTSSKIHGSLLKQPIESSFHFAYLKGAGEYKVSSSYGPNAHGKFGGKYDVRGGDTPIFGELELELSSPSPKLKSLKAKTSGSVLIPKEPTGELKVQGTASVFADSNSGTLIDFNSDGQVRASDKDGELKGNLKSTQLGPVSVVAGYSRKGEGDKQQLNGNFALQSSKNANFKFDGSLHRLSKNEYKLEAEIDTPIEKFKKNTIKVSTKRSDDTKHVTSKVEVNNDGQLWSVDTELKASEIAPLIDIKWSCPLYKNGVIHVDSNRVSDKEFSINYKFLCEKADFLLEGDVDANLANIENFYVKGKIHSPKLDLNKITFEANNKPGNGGKRIQINIKSAESNLISGSTSYTAHEEHGKYIIEGSGSLKVKEENKAANFKYISQQLTNEKNGEQGFEISFDAGIGEKAIDAEFKATNKQFRISDSYCEKKKECAYIEYDSKINQNDVDKFDHVLEITVDLRKLGIPNEFGLKSVTTRNNWVLDHTVDVHFQSPENSKYQYSVYLHPQEAGVSLTTPKRIISLEGHLKGPKDLKQTGGKLSAEVAFFVDKKNQPNQKAALVAWLSTEIKPGKGPFNGEVKFTHPGLARPLSISVQTLRSGEMPNTQSSISLTVDIFEQQNQKLVTEYKVTPKIDGQHSHYSVDSNLNIKSSGLGIDIVAAQQLNIDRHASLGEYSAKIKYHVGNSNYENQFVIKGGKAGSHLLVRLLNVDVFKMDNKYTISKDEQVIDSEISSYDRKPIIVHLEIKKYNTILYTVGCKDNPKEKLQFNTGLIPGQIADLRADHITGSGKVNIYHATLKLDEANFLKPDYNINTKEIETVIEKSRIRIKTFVNGLQNIGKEWNNDIRKETSQLSELTKKAAPNLEPLKHFYETELGKFKNEIVQDKSLQEIGELLKSFFFAITDVTSVVVVKVAEVAQALTRAVQTVLLAVVESFEKHLVPALKEVAERITNIIAEIVNTFVDIVSNILAAISQIIEKYQPEIKQLVATFGELGQDIARFIQKSYEQVRKIISNIYQKIYIELKAIPIFEELKAQWDDLVRNGLTNAEGVLGGIKEIAATLKDLIPPEVPIQEELFQIIDVTVDYLEKKIKQQPVDDLAVLDKLFNIYVNLAKKVINILTSQTSDIHQPQVSLSFDFFKKLPKLVAVRFSPLDYILREDPSREIITFALSLLNNPRQWVPPFPLNAEVIGQHIFTFDGKYVNFPANCKYLLARDAVNGNFTVIGTFANGLLSAITVADHHDSITVNANGKVTLNNAHVELPARKPDLHAWREYDSVSIKSKAGVRVRCHTELLGCDIHVSGFYHAQLKGLLGKGNNEPYDDFTIPNGKIVTSASEFGNSYKIGNCQPVNIPAAAANNPACDKLFGWDSSLRLCYPFVDTSNYKMACAEGLAANVKHTEQIVATGYVIACLDHHIPVSIPSNLVKCTNADTPHTVGEQFSVKVPGTSADIVLLVDTIKTNKPVYDGLIKPLVTELTKDLAAKGIKDIEFHLITYGNESDWPNHVTVGGKLTFKDKAPEIKFPEPPKQAATLFKELEPLKDILRDVELALGLDLQARTYTEGYEYPFRANAAKSIIAVTGGPCSVGNLYPLQRLRTLLFRNNQISLNLITPFDGLSVKDPKKTKDVIGFNDDHVFTISHDNKKPEANAELYKHLQYNDYCVDFTVKNRGNVFVTNNFLAGKPDVRKQFVEIASQKIVEEITNIEEGLDCECRQFGAFLARNVCTESYSKEKNRK